MKAVFRCLRALDAVPIRSHYYSRPHAFDEFALVRRSGLSVALVIAIGSGAALGAGSGNPVNDRLLSLAPAERARTIGENVGEGCIGTSAFQMGVVSTEKWKALAYWSVRCKDGRSFVIQITPDGHMSVTDCKTLQANGKECFKKL